MFSYEKRMSNNKIMSSTYFHTSYEVQKTIFVSFRKCLGASTPWMSPLTTPERQNSCSDTAKQSYVWLWKRMSATSIMYSFKWLHTSHGILYKRCLYHSRSSLVLILHERIRVPPDTAQNLAAKLLNKGTFGYEKWATLKLWLPRVCTDHEIYEICLYHSGSALILILQEKVHWSSRNAQNLALKPLNGGTFGCKKGWATLK